MPVIRLETNITLEENNKKAFGAKLSSFASKILAKPESVMMIILLDGINIYFAEGEGPAAMVEIGSVGLGPDKCGELTEKICSFIKNELGIEAERTYIEFKNLDPKMFGWNKKTLA